MNEKKPDNKAELDSPTYRLAALDQDFLLGDSTRGLRFQLEYEKTEQALRARGIASTIVVFGSARICENGPPHHAAWYAAARDFAAVVSQEGGAKARDASGFRRNVIATGGGPGLMEAANRGAYDVGAPSIGLNITLPHEQQPNAYSTPDLTFLFHYFAMRKMHFAMRANALVAFPGGFGTLDELFEVLTLRQTRKSRALPIVLFDEAYWKRLIDFDYLAEEGMIAGEDLNLMTFVNCPRAAWQAIATAAALENPV